MDEDIPQDEYFEWEDIISYKAATAPRTMEDVTHSPINLFNRHSNEDLDFLPQYESPTSFRKHMLAPKGVIDPKSAQPDQIEKIERAEDDTAIIAPPSKHVDYLSHDWCEEDIWSTWKYLKSTRQVYKNSERLANASWRMWMKERHQLPETEPLAINWQKERDTTWLYGPLQPKSESMSDSLQSSQVIADSKMPVRPILKKPSLSETLLRKSISCAALAREANIASKEALNLVRHGISRQTSLPAHLSMNTEERTKAWLGSHSKLHPSKTPPAKSVRFSDQIEESSTVSPGSSIITIVESIFEDSDEEDDENSDVETSPKSLATATPPTAEIASLALDETTEDDNEMVFNFGEYTLSPECESEASDESTGDYFGSEQPDSQDVTMSILGAVREDLVDSVMDEFWAIFNQEWDAGFKQRNGDSRGSSNSSNDSTSASRANASTGRVQRKRQRGESENSDGDDARDVRARQQPKSKRGSEDLIKFACPFRKHDNSTYNIYTHRLDTHITVASEDICEVKVGTAPEGITAEIERQLRSRKKAHPNQSEEDRWRDIYKILFPNHEIPSPYFEAVHTEGPSSPDSRELSNYEDYIRRELPRLVRSNIESVVRHETQPLEAALIGNLVSIIQDCQDRVFRSYRETQGFDHDMTNEAQVKDEVAAAAVLDPVRPWMDSMSHPNWQQVERADDEADWWMNI
ncbi:putative Resistance to glucose repression protein 1 [Glarea lozoyensis 74030]|uniref:Putative Resistance to glucose repression protein 1 n=1 Tax=Glarea lozoyensis (strain ATCC 74030 / MF5533) TaxID=1104152 RepID=H0EF59_GLAL7|nr:putative Resistance to glucose repression protein 1 [Glarea lozoyensis 74030]